MDNLLNLTPKPQRKSRQNSSPEEWAKIVEVRKKQSKKTEVDDWPEDCTEQWDMYLINNYSLEEIEARKEKPKLEPKQEDNQTPTTSLMNKMDKMTEQFAKMAIGN